MRNVVINVVWFQAIWFASVLGAAHQLLWPAVVLLLTFAVWQARPDVRQEGDLKLVASAILLGVLFDGALQYSGLLIYALPSPVSYLPPAWILMLWVGFALTLNHSLKWMQKPLWVAFVAGAIFGPGAYIAAEKLKAVEWTQAFIPTALILALAWGTAILVLSTLAKIWREQQDHNAATTI